MTNERREGREGEWVDNKHVVRADTRDEGEDDVFVVARDAADLLQVPDLALLRKGVRHCAGHTSTMKKKKKSSCIGTHGREVTQTLVELGVGEDKEVVGALGDKGHVCDIVLCGRNDAPKLRGDEGARQRPVHVVRNRALQQRSQVRNGWNLLRHIRTAKQSGGGQRDRVKKMEQEQSARQSKTSEAKRKKRGRERKRKKRNKGSG